MKACESLSPREREKLIGEWKDCYQYDGERPITVCKTSTGGLIIAKVDNQLIIKKEETHNTELEALGTVVEFILQKLNVVLKGRENPYTPLQENINWCEINLARIQEFARYYQLEVAKDDVLNFLACNTVLFRKDENGESCVHRVGEAKTPSKMNALLVKSNIKADKLLKSIGTFRALEKKKQCLSTLFGTNNSSTEEGAVQNPSLRLQL